MNSKTVFFVRHGETEWNAAARMQGQQDSKLTELGRKQAAGHGRLLAAAGIDALFASPLGRVRETVEIIRRFVPIDVRFDDRIKEWNCGHWSGHLRADVKRRWKLEWAALAADPYHYRGPGCENYPDMIARARPFVDELLAGPGRVVAIVSHGMIGRVMVGIMMGFSQRDMLAFKQPNDVVYRVCPDESVASGRRLDHFVAGRGPFDGVVPRQ